MTARRFALLDRDGVIIEDKNYLSDPDQVVFLPGAVAGMRRLRALGLGLIVVTNQSGVGRGYFTLEAMHRVNRRMEALLLAEGVPVEGIFSCPHATEEGCGCRKPRPGLVEQAVAVWGFDPRRCFLAGDKESDLALARSVGAAAFLVHGAETPPPLLAVPPDGIVTGLEELAEQVARRLAGGETPP